MPRQMPPSTLKQMSEINLTPLMDLTFILLITFIITFPLIEQGIPINLPTQKAAPIEATQSKTVTIDNSGIMYFDHDPISDVELQQAVTALLEVEPQATVFIRADEALAYGKVVDVMKILRQANVTRLALVTQSDE
ncbi:MAG: biopolymer transporter ExbD [Kiritimatiellae bacterium]|nr:biopolymer transporter ExbD [Kiritimatiellia bacterium]